MWLYDTKTLRFISVNDAAILLYGYSREEFLSMTIEQIRPEQDIAALRKVVSEGRPGIRKSGIWKHRLKNSGTIYVDISSHTLEVGGIAAALVLIHNMTEEILAQLSLQRSEERFRSVFEQAALGLCIVALDKTFLRVNPAFCQMLGYSAEELVRNHTCVDTTHPDDWESDEQAVEKVLGGAPSVVFEKRYLNKCGVAVPARVTLSLHHAEGMPNHFVGIVENLSDVRLAELEKEKLSRLMASLLSSVGEGIYGLDSRGCCTFINPAGANILGYPINEIVGRRLHDLIHHHHADGADHSALDCPILRVYNKGESCSIEDDIFWKSNGSPVPVSYMAEPILEQGLVTGTVVAFRDVSDRKRFEERLIEQAALLDIVPDAILVKDMSQRIIFWNKGAQEMYGWSAAEAMGRESRELLQLDEAQSDEAFRLLLSKGEWRGEMIEKTKDNRFLTVDVRWTLIRDKEGQPKSILAIKADITHEKKLEEQIMRAQRMESIGTLPGAWLMT